MWGRLVEIALISGLTILFCSTTFGFGLVSWLNRSIYNKETK